MAQLILSTFNGQPYPAVNYFDDPPLGPGPLLTTHAKIKLTPGEAILSIDQLLRLHVAGALDAQKKGSGLT